MTLRMDKQSDGHTMTLRLIGHLQVEHLEAVQEQLQSPGSRIVLDLDDVTVGDVEVVRFLGRCEQEGTDLLHCPPYIRKWIEWEQQI